MTSNESYKTISSNESLIFVIDISAVRPCKQKKIRCLQEYITQFFGSNYKQKKNQMPTGIHNKS